MKLRKNIVAFLLASIFILTSCNTGSKESIDRIEDNKDLKKPEVVRIATNTEPDSFDPFISALSDTEAIMFNVYEGLISFDSKGEIIPGIAKEWEISSDGLTYTFYLNENVFFHNDKKLTSEDVIFTYSKLAGLNGEEAATTKFSGVASAEALDELTVAIRLTEKDASFLSKCKASIVQKGYADNEHMPIGTGPYKFSEYSPGQKVVLEINKNYYNDKRKGQISKAEFLIMSDENAKINALRTGALDLFDASKEVIDQVPDNFTKYHNYSGTVNTLALNIDREPFNDVKVRQAISYAMDRSEISDIISSGEGTPIYTTFSPVTKWYNKETETVYDYNIEKAKALLKEAGYENGFSMEITVPSNYNIHVSTAEIFLNQLEKAGIKGTIRKMEMAQWYSEVYSEGNYHATIIGLTGKIDPNDIAIRFHSQYIRNFYHYNNPEYDKIVEDALLENDSEKRLEMYNKAQMILTEDGAAIFIMDPGRDVASNPGLKGYTSYPVTFWDLSSLYFE